MAFQGKNGDRVQLVFAASKPNSVFVGETGTITSAQDLRWGQDIQTEIHIELDSGKKITCLCPPDYVERLAAND